MDIEFIFRNKNTGFSINKVFENLFSHLYARSNTNISKVELPSPGAMPLDLVKNILFILKKIKKNKLYHIVGSENYLLLFLPRNRSIVTVHDIGFYTQEKNKIKKLYKYLFYLVPLKLATKIICISNITSEVLVDIIKIKQSKICIIHNPIGHEFQFSPKEFNKKCPVILHIGTRPHKNLKNSALALKGFNCHLRIIGPLNEEYKDLLDSLCINYSQTEKISDEDLLNEYINCDIVNFPSLHEGFGMPIIEGQSIGRIVITSNTLPMSNVCGHGGILVDPNNIISIKNAYDSAINNDDYRNEIIQKGLSNLSRFSIDYICNKYLDVYKSLF